jgi:hypothetical protein
MAMMAADVLQRYRSILADIGEDIAVRRYAGTGAGRAIVQEAIARGRVAGLDANDIVGDIKLTDSKVILINDPGAAVPDGKVALSAMLPLTTNDKLFFRGHEVAIIYPDDDTRRVAGVLIALEILVRD